MFSAKLTIFIVFMIAEAIVAQSQPGDVVGKLTVGYQGWFSVFSPDNKSPMNAWGHWSDTNGPPGPGHLSFELWPDFREYTKLYPTNFLYQNGSKAGVYNSWDDQTIETHFRWMKEYGLDTAAIQRFRPRDNTILQFKNDVATKCKNAAEKYGCKFYIAYDWNGLPSEIIQDVNNVLRSRLNIFNSTAYARQNGKPVISLFGIGFQDRANDRTGHLNLINQLKRDFYVIGGVPRGWRTLEATHPNYGDVFAAYNMISPWTVGGYTGVKGAQDYANRERADFQYCNQLKIDYQPIIFPGSAWSNSHPTYPRNENPRLHGDFMWRQFVNLREIGIKNVYIAMFDEFDEGTAIAKCAETKDQAPTNQYFLLLDADGVRVSSDFYMRLANDGKRMMLGQTPLRFNHTTPFFPVPSTPSTPSLPSMSTIARILSEFRNLLGLF